MAPGAASARDKNLTQGDDSRPAADLRRVLEDAAWTLPAPARLRGHILSKSLANGGGCCAPDQPPKIPA